MRRLKVVVWVLLGMVADAAWAQSAKDAEKAFETSVKGKRLVLRDYSAESKRAYRWVGDALESDAPLARTLGIFEAKSVKWKPDKVEIRGTRTTVVKGDHGLEAEGPSTMLLTIDAKGADPLVVASKLKEQMFESNMADAALKVPLAYRNDLPYDMKKQEGKGTPAAKPYDIAVKDQGGSKACSAAGGVTPPKLLHHVDPEFSEEARDKKYSGKSTVELMVDTTGHVVNPWIAVAAGMGLDEQATKAVVQYVFQPAMCGGVPKTVMLVIDVNFEIH